MKKKLFFTLCLGVCLGVIGTLLGIRYAPKMSLEKGLSIQKKVCPMFAVQANNYNALKTKRDALKKTLKDEREKTKKEIDSLTYEKSQIKKQLSLAEKFLRPTKSQKRSKKSIIFQNYLTQKDDLKKL